MDLIKPPQAHVIYSLIRGIKMRRKYMQVKECMSSKPEFLPPTATLKEAAEKMSKLNFGFIPVGENDKLIGAITDRDLTVRAVAKGKDPTKTTIKEVMSEGIQYCFDSDDLPKAIKKMEELKVRRLVVLNKDKRMIGILSLGDIATKGHSEDLCAELTEAVSHHD